MEIGFHFQKKCSLKGRRRLKTFIVSMFIKEKTEAKSLNIIFCDDAYLLKINQSFLQHDFYTDIISFNLGDKQQPVEGELYISVDRVRENAVQHSVGFNEEVHRVIIHGILHLCGYLDKTKMDIEKMRKGESRYLSMYFDHIAS